MRVYLFVLVVAAAVTYLTTPLARRLARRIGAITPVRDRDVHSVPVPRMGGTAIMAGFAASMLAGSQTPFLAPVFAKPEVYAVLFGAFAVCLLGVADDLWTLDAVTKLAGQSLAAGVMAWQGVQFTGLPIMGITITGSGSLLVATVLAVVVTINAVNFVDGLDGLAAGIVAIAGSAFFVYSYLLSRDATPEDLSSLASLVTAGLVGSCIGFLPHNFNPARVFMGDSGSMLIGLLLATSTVAITSVDTAAASNAQGVHPVRLLAPAYLPILLPLAVLALPLMDLVLAVVRRTRAGRKPWHPDKLHLHHRMLGLGHSHARAVLVMYVWTATAAFGVASVAFVRLRVALVAGVLAVALAVFLTLGPLRSTGLTRRRTL